MNHFYRNQINQIKNTNQSVQFINSANGDPANNSNITKSEYHFNREICEGVQSNFNKNEEKSTRLLNKENMSSNSRPSSVSKSLAQSKEHSYFTNNNSKISNTPSIQSYLDRRHQETQQKINQMRADKFKRETQNMQFRPKISDNSKKIIDNIIKRENSRDPIKIREKTDVIQNKIERNNSQSKLFYNIRNESNDYVPLKLNREEKHESVRVDERRYNLVNTSHFKNNPDLKTNNNRPNEQELIKRPASANPKARAEKSNDLNLNNNLILSNKSHIQNKNSQCTSVIENKKNICKATDNNKSHTDKNIYKQYDEEKVMEIRNKLNEYYIENKKPLNSGVNIRNNTHRNNPVSKQSQGITKLKTQPVIMYNYPLRESENNLFPFNNIQGNDQLNRPVKLQQLTGNNNTDKFNSIQSISITNNNRVPVKIINSNNVSDGLEIDVNLTKREEDLKILKNFAENVSVNQSYDYNDKRNYSSVDDTNPYSIYNKKQIQRKEAKESNQNIKSEFKLDKFSRDYLLNKLNTFNRDPKFFDNN